jgi:hypothetical protein
LRQEAADVTRLATEMGRLLRDDRARTVMADASRACGKPGAARDVAADLLVLAGIAERPHTATNGSSRAAPRAQEAS